MSIFTGHPDWLPGATVPSYATIEDMVELVPANSGVTHSYPPAQLGGIIAVTVRGTGELNVTVSPALDTSPPQERYYCGSLDGNFAMRVVATTPLAAQVDVDVYNTTGVDQNMRITTLVWTNVEKANIYPSAVAYDDFGFTVAAAATAVCQSIPYPGVFDRCQGFVQLDQPMTASIRWGKRDFHGGVMRTYDEQLGAVAANVPVYFDSPIRAPAGALLVHNTGAGLGTVQSYVRSYRQS